MTHQDAGVIDGTVARRELIHDLRNLFGVVASARHMLDDRPSDDRRKSLLDAIEGAALRGGQLATDLLIESSTAVTTRLVDVSNRLLALVPLVRAMAGARADVSFDLSRLPTIARTSPKLFEAAILELIANASAVLRRRGHIHVRTRRVGNRIHILVADDGPGMSPEHVKRALAHDCRTGANGIGLGRVRHFAATTHGALRMRSRIGRGTVVSLNLPMVLHLAVDEPASSPTRPTPRTTGARS